MANGEVARKLEDGSGYIQVEQVILLTDEQKRRINLGSSTVLNAEEVSRLIDKSEQELEHLTRRLNEARSAKELLWRFRERLND